MVTNPASYSSFHTEFSNNIVYAIVDASYNIVTSDVATISGTTITLLRSGRFRIRATTTRTSIFTSVPMWSTVVTVNRAIPEFQTTPWNPIPPILFLRDTATITPPVFRFPLPVPPEILNITYGYISLPTHIRPSTRIITITPATQPEPPAAPVQTSVRIESAGRFIITATTRKSLRYEQVTFRSSELQASDPRTPVINFPTSGFTGSVIFGVQPYQLNQAGFTYPSTTPSGVTISYSITQELQFPSDPRNVNNVANIINGTTIRINNVGRFYILARTNSTNAFNVAERRSPRVTVTPAATTLQTTRWNAFPNITTPITLFVDQPLTIVAPSFQSPSQDERRINGIRIVYFINNATTYINGPSFTVQAAGTLVVRAETRSNLNSNYSNARSINSEHITITFINRPPPRIVRDRVNVQTLVFQEGSIPQSPTFMEQSPRGFPEWFAVVDQRSVTAIANYARERAGNFFGGGTATFITSSLNGTILIPFNNIVTTLMTNMNSLFSGITNFNELITSWDTSRVTGMNNMFNGCTIFDQRLDTWNTSQVVDMGGMFAAARKFNNGFNLHGVDSMNWNTSRVRNMSQMFNAALLFNRHIAHWDTRAVTDMNFVFLDARGFNRWISWDTSAVTTMAGMFTRATSFNNHLDLNTSRVTNMNGMFSGATLFTGTGNIWQWDTSRIAGMNGTFQGATNFNQNIGNWNTSNVRDMGAMFNNATNFNHPIGNWNTLWVTNMGHMFDGATNFNNGHFAPEYRFNGYLSFQQREQNFIPAWVATGIFARTEQDRIFHETNNNNRVFSMTSPRQTMNWNTSHVINMNFMFHNARSFVNTDIRRWGIVAAFSPQTTGFRRNCPLPDEFTVFSIWLGSNPGSSNRGR